MPCVAQPPICDAMDSDGKSDKFSVEVFKWLTEPASRTSSTLRIKIRARFSESAELDDKMRAFADDLEAKGAEVKVINSKRLFIGLFASESLIKALATDERAQRISVDAIEVDLPGVFYDDPNVAAQLLQQELLGMTVPESWRDYRSKRAQ